MNNILHPSYGVLTLLIVQSTGISFIGLLCTLLVQMIRWNYLQYSLFVAKH